MNSSSPPLLPIGAFSSATQISAKALRLYADQGILVPAKIDIETGYRYYRASQVQEARLVRLLRELGIPLAQIALMLAQPTTIDAQLKLHMEGVSRRYAQQQIAYRTTFDLLQAASGKNLERVFERRQTGSHVAVIPFEASQHSLIPRARALLKQAVVEIGRHHIEDQPIFIQPSGPLGAHEEIAVELCLPVAARDGLPTNYAIRFLQEQSLAVTALTQNSDGIDFVGASDALFDWFDRYGKTLSGSPIIFMHDHGTELAWRISQGPK